MDTQPGARVIAHVRNAIPGYTDQSLKAYRRDLEASIDLDTAYAFERSVYRVLLALTNAELARRI